MIRALLCAALAIAPAMAVAAPLTVHTGETWLFVIERGDPARPRKAEPTVNPAPGEVRVTLRALFGTMMTITSNSAQGYTFQAELIGADGKAVTARSCTLPSGDKPALETWPQKAAAVRIGKFRPAKGGHC